MSSASYQKYFNQYTRKGYVLDKVNGYSIGTKDYYAAIWIKRKQGFVARHGMAEKQFAKYHSDYAFKGWQIKKVSGYARRGQRTYAALWTPKRAAL